VDFLPVVMIVAVVSLFCCPCQGRWFWVGWSTGGPHHRL